ncbi:polysaccharide pyruvyl transferase family protein [Pedobacter mucosus]|uniref:polysaccharide pyruvyl transferase family protein n=1 Tax=Pedobacter mucosus TaxID=2895286 RepID=UPI001EE40C56|nr:polysaccharide pyruvyl transferase family protein [Pedobacter mucosus]UKT64942.1 polysaccharide pyruvyl transferase family protein [Pedobacter mucosus]
MTQDRRTFIKNISFASAGAMLLPITDAIANSVFKGKKILIRSGWQTVNIGDIGHTFGLLAIMEKFLPEMELVLWIKSYDRGVEPLLRKNFPKVKVIKSKMEDNAADLKEAFEECAFMIHSSGPFVTAQKELEMWSNTTKKPFGIYGVSLDEVSPELQNLISKAAFFYCRDTESLKYFKSLNNKCPIQGFAPDSTFGIKVYDDEKANAYLDKVGLKRGEFICVIPKLRHTAYWQLVGREPSESEKEKYAISMAHKKNDGEKMRNVIIAWVKATNLQVLICPEVTYQVELGKETLYDPLPSDIKKNVVWRDAFWGPDEATSVYKHARAMVCCEPHSLIMAVANNIPSIHVKQAQDTRKGQMWRDIGLGDWYFLMDETPSSQISAKLLDIHKNYAEAQKTTKKAFDFVVNIQKETMQVVKKFVV